MLKLPSRPTADRHLIADTFKYRKFYRRCHVASITVDTFHADTSRRIYRQKLNKNKTKYFNRNISNSGLGTHSEQRK